MKKFRVMPRAKRQRWVPPSERSPTPIGADDAEPESVLGEQDGSTNEGPPAAGNRAVTAQHKRRNRALGIGLAAVIASSTVSWAAASRIRSPAEIAARTAPPTASLISVPVSKRVLSSDVVVRGTVRYGAPQAISLPVSALKKGSSGIVTTPAVKGKELSEGSVALTISGRPVFVLQGAQPAYRDMGPGASGDDVRQLEEALARLGFKPGPVDGVYDSRTADAVGAWYLGAGFTVLGPTEEQLAALRAGEGDRYAAKADLLQAQEALTLAQRDLATARQRAALGLPGLVVPGVPPVPAAPRPAPPGAPPAAPAPPANEADQARYNEEKTRYDQEMARYNEEKARYDQEMARYNQEKARYDQEKARYDQERVAASVKVSNRKRALNEAIEEERQAQARMEEARTRRPPPSNEEYAQLSRDSREASNRVATAREDLAVAEEELAAIEANAPTPPESPSSSSPERPQSPSPSSPSSSSPSSSDAYGGGGGSGGDSGQSGSGGDPAQAARDAAQAARDAALAARDAKLEGTAAQGEVDKANAAVEYARQRVALMAQRALLGLGLGNMGVSVPADEVLFFPNLPLRVDDVKLKPGDEALGAIMTVTNSRLVVDTALSANDAKLVRQGAPVTLKAPDLGLDAKGTVTYLATTPGTNGVDPQRFYMEVTPTDIAVTMVGASVVQTITVSSTEGAVLTVPVAALSVSADGDTRLQVRSPDGTTRYVSVDPGLTAKGLVAVTPTRGALASGDLVVVGRGGGAGLPKAEDTVKTKTRTTTSGGSIK